MKALSRLLSSVAACLGLITATPWAAAQSYPDKPVRLIVPWSAGGAVDAAARALAAGIGPRLRQPVIVDNKPGASGSIGAMAAATSTPDGYTFFLGNVDTHVVNPQVLPNLRYKPVEDFDPIVEIGRIPMVLVVRNGLKGPDAAELTRIARLQPGRISYATWGVGSVAHLAFAMLEQQAGIELNHVPFQGAAPTYTAILGGHVDMALSQVPWALGAAREGKVQVLGITSGQRTSLAPAMPTLAEAGFKGYAAEQWVALFAPKGVPPAVRERINREVNAWLATPEGQSQLREGGIEPTGGTAAQLAERQKSETASWGRLIRQKNIAVATLR
jgi:tripartite-type tricarboxylate transporter receptor subunit TctC